MVRPARVSTAPAHSQGDPNEASKTFASAVGALALAAAAAYAPAASADRVGFNVTFGGPGYAVNVGNGGYGYYDHWRPAPVVVAPLRALRPYRTTTGRITVRRRSRAGLSAVPGLPAVLR